MHISKLKNGKIKLKKNFFNFIGEPENLFLYFNSPPTLRQVNYGTPGFMYRRTFHSSPLLRLIQMI